MKVHPIRRIIVAICAALASVGVTVGAVSIGTASATSCTTHKYTASGSSYCTSLSFGQFWQRAVIECADNSGQLHFTAYGPFVRINQFSNAYCVSSGYHVAAVSWQTI